MKKIIPVVGVLIALGIGVLCFSKGTEQSLTEDFDYTVRDNVKYYEKDFTVEYAPTLNAMFSTGWQIADKQEIREEVSGCEHMDTRDIDYYIWDIEYTDYMGNKRIFKLNNHHSLSYQVEKRFTDLIKQHYEEQYFNKYFNDIPLKDHYVYCFFVNPSGSTSDDWTDERWLSAMDKIDEYKERLGTVGGAIDFCSLVPEEAFKTYPIRLAVSISLEDENGNAKEKERIDKLAKERTEQMIEEINRAASGCFNAHFSVDSQLGRNGSKLYDGETSWRWEYVQGQECEDLDSHKLYEAYENTCFGEW